MIPETGGPPSVTAVVIRSADPIKRIIVSRFSSADQARHHVGEIVMGTGRVVDAVTAAPRRTALQADELSHEPRMIEKVDPPRMAGATHGAAAFTIMFITIRASTRFSELPAEP